MWMTDWKVQTKAEPPRKPNSRQKGMQIMEYLMENHIYTENDKTT